MAKFSVFREGEDDDDDDDELFADSAPEPEPKRRRISNAGSPSSTTQLTKELSVLPAESIAVLAGEGSEKEIENADVEETPAGGPISVILSNPDVLDCSICFDPLTIPVYQCPNGHTACSSCCTNLRNRCPCCCETIGHIRCRAIESVVESVKVSCSYKTHGCLEKVSYCSKLSHEEDCVYAPYPCPFQDCIFRGSPKRLSSHLNEQHTSSVISFRFNYVSPICIEMTDKFLVLQEEKAGILFILNIRSNSIAIRCISSTHHDDYRFAYTLDVRQGSSSLRFQSFTDKARRGLDDSPSVDFLQVPSYFLNSSGLLRLEVSIWSKGASYAEISRAISDVHEAEVGNSLNDN